MVNEDYQKPSVKTCSHRLCDVKGTG